MVTAHNSAGRANRSDHPAAPLMQHTTATVRWANQHSPPRSGLASMRGTPGSARSELKQPQFASQDETPWHSYDSIAIFQFPPMTSDADLATACARLATTSALNREGSILSTVGGHRIRSPSLCGLASDELFQRARTAPVCVRARRLFEGKAPCRVGGLELRPISAVFDGRTWKTPRQSSPAARSARHPRPLVRTRRSTGAKTARHTFEEVRFPRSSGPTRQGTAGTATSRRLVHDLP